MRTDLLRWCAFAVFAFVTGSMAGVLLEAARGDLPGSWLLPAAACWSASTALCAAGWLLAGRRLSPPGYGFLRHTRGTLFSGRREGPPPAPSGGPAIPGRQGRGGAPGGFPLHHLVPPGADCRIMRAGAVIAVRVRGVRPDGSAHRPGDPGQGAVAEFFAPGRDPEHVPADRGADKVLVLPFDPVSRTYGREVSTAGWVPGDWTVRGAVLGPDGTPEGWEYHRFPLDP